MSILDDLMGNMASGVVGGGRIRFTSQEVAERLDFYRDSMEGFKVTDEHRLAFESIFRDINNTFLTGGAGVGKTSFVRNILIPELHYRGLNVAVTATTGIAGSHLSGRTVHSWAGIGLGPKFPPGVPVVNLEERYVYAAYEETYRAWMASPKQGMRDGVKKRICGTEVLIIDEISMAGGVTLLGYLDFFFKKIRGNSEPFGGLQVIFIGDFGQLPPVDKPEGERPDWAFLSPAWRSARVHAVEFTEVFRQADKEFSDFLNATRVGQPLDKVYAQRFLKPIDLEMAMKSSFLVPINKQADDLNKKALDYYPGEVELIEADFQIKEELFEKWDTHDKVRQQLLNTSAIFKEVLYLKVGIPVLFTFNHPDGDFVNGTKGFIEEIRKDENGAVQTVVVRKATAKGKPVAAEASEDPNTLTVPNDLVYLNRKRYTRSQHEDPTIETIVTEESPDGRKIRKSVSPYQSVTQFPIIPATAITVHKSQGMSLDDCVIDLRRSFAAGHVYVAMSRLRSAEGLTLTSLDFEVKTDPHVMQYYRTIRQNQKRPA